MKGGTHRFSNCAEGCAWDLKNVRGRIPYVVGVEQRKKLPATAESLYGSGRRIRTAKNVFYEQITSNYVIFSSETIKHGISQSSCFIEDGPLKGQDKGQSRNA